MAETPVGPGTLLAGRFVLEDLLDDTEGARFWRATDRTLARSVAVHVIAAEDPRSEALLNAARTSATVSDGHLLRVLDAATEDGVTYVVNEWGHGISLDRLLAEGPLSARRAAWVVKEVAEAISTAHRHGIAHGRLLPENVMVTEAGSVKLIGFVVDAVIRGRDQARVTGGRPLGEHEADVVNLAALLYAGLVAKWPGTDGSALPDAPTEHGRALRPRQVRAGVPRPLDAICERVLNADPLGPATPLETAHEIYAALSDFIGDATGAAPVGFEPTAFFDEAELAHLRGDALPDAVVEDTGEQDALDATQAGAPVFDDEDEDTAVGWTPTQGGGESDDPEATQLTPAPKPSRTPAPDFPPLPQRPLFASDTPRAPRPAGQPRSTGAGNGSLPPVWGPDPQPPTPAREWDTSSWDDDAPGRSWLRLALAIGGVLLLVVAIIVAFNLGQGTGPEEASESPSTEPSSAPAEPITIAGVTDFDPAGDPPEENPESAPLAADGNPRTAWRTSTYFDPLNLLKPGVGLLVDLGEPTEVSQVDVSFIGSPTSFEILAAEDGAAAPTSNEGLARVGKLDNASTQGEVPLDEPITTQYLVVWLTDLPPADGGFRGQVAEIVVR
ncbi:MAG: protein kinase domain-containing protein [Nocardioides sp.]